MKIIFLSGLFLFVYHLSPAQQIAKSVLASAGTTLQSQNLVLDLTLGESVVHHFGDEGMGIQAGFHQGAPPIATGINVFPTHTIQIGVVVKPNPVKELLQITTDQRAGLQYVIMDMFGRRWRHSDFTTSAEVDMRPLPPGSYALLIKKGAEVISNQTVIKIQ